MEKDKGIWCV